MDSQNNDALPGQEDPNNMPGNPASADPGADPGAEPGGQPPEKPQPTGQFDAQAAFQGLEAQIKQQTDAINRLCDALAPGTAGQQAPPAPPAGGAPAPGQAPPPKPPGQMDSEEAFRAAVRARVDLEATARNERVQFDSAASDSELKAAILKGRNVEIDESWTEAQMDAVLASTKLERRWRTRQVTRSNNQADSEPGEKVRVNESNFYNS